MDTHGGAGMHGMIHAFREPHRIDLVINACHLSLAVEKDSRVMSAVPVFSIDGADDVSSMFLGEARHGIYGRAVK
jgi:hypothetical protein